MTTETNELHWALAKMQVLMTQAADRLAHYIDSLAESHTKDGIVQDVAVQLILESEADLIDALRAAALPWDQRHKSTERPPRRAHQFPAETVEAVRADLQGALQAHGLDPKNSETITQTFEGLPLRKLKTLLSDGWGINGVSIERTEEDGTARRGAVTTGGMVLWWNQASELISMSKEDAKSVMKALDDFDGWADHGCPASTAVAVKIMRGALTEREPTDSMGMPLSCGKPLCAPGDHHPLCKLATPPAAQPNIGIPISTPAAPTMQRCKSCDGTGDVHDQTGEWRGACHCAKDAQPAPVQKSYAICGATGHKEICDSPGASITRSTGCPAHDQPGALHMTKRPTTEKSSAVAAPVQEPSEEVLIDSRAYTVPAAVAVELLRLHLTVKAAAPVQEMTNLHRHEQNVQKFVGTQPAPVPEGSVSKGEYNRLRDDYNDFVNRSEQDAKDAKRWRKHVNYCQLQGIDLDYQITTPPAAQPAVPYGWVRMNPGFNSGVFHLGTECPPGWVGSAAPVSKIAAPEKPAEPPSN